MGAIMGLYIKFPSAYWSLKYRVSRLLSSSLMMRLPRWRTKQTQLALLQQKLASLEAEQATFIAQRKLLEQLVFMARTPEKKDVLKSSLQNVLDFCVQLTNAEAGSLFLVDSAGRVTQSILARNSCTAKERQQVIGTVLSKGLAGWVNLNRQTALVMDTSKDERWLTLPNQPYQVGSALAVPILWGEELLGLLTLMHSQTEHFDASVATIMEQNAEQLALVLENALLYGKLGQYNTFLNTELDKGKQIQQDFLPCELPQVEGWQINAIFHPARTVSGDFYDVFELPGGYLGLVIADVCDKGVGAALFMGLFRSLIRVFSGQTSLQGLSLIGVNSSELASSEIGSLYLDGLDSSAQLQLATDIDQIAALKAIPITNNYVATNHFRLNMFATVFFGVLNPQTGTLSYINAGHETLFVLGNSGVKKCLQHTGGVVGIMPNSKFKVRQVQLEPGDTLIGYTDGVTDARSPGGEFFRQKRLLELLEKPGGSTSELLEQISNHLFAHIDNATQFDDITMLAVHREG